MIVRQPITAVQADQTHPVPRPPAWKIKQVKRVNKKEGIRYHIL